MTDDEVHFARDGLAFNRATTFIDGVFAIFAALMSATELILWVVAGKQGLFIHPLSDERKRKVFATSVAPIPAFLLSVPLAFVSTLAAVSCWVVVITVQGWIATHRHSHTQEVTA